MPNTVVKLTNAESTWLEAAREDRKLLINKEALTVSVGASLLCLIFLHPISAVLYPHASARFLRSSIFGSVVDIPDPMLPPVEMTGGGSCLSYFYQFHHI